MLAAALLAGIGLATAVAEEAVLTLSGANFTKHLEANKAILVEFYAPWCGHCKKLAPEYEKAAAQLKASGVPLAKVDATEEKDLASKYDVKGFPTLVWFQDQQKVDYDGGRTADTIVQWVSSMTGPAVTSGAEPAEPGEVPRVVLHSSSLSTAFEDAAKSARRKASWWFVESSGPTKVVLTHKGEEPIEDTLGVGTKEDILKLLDDNILPLWGKLDGQTFDKYINSGRGLVWTLYKHDSGAIDQVAQANRAAMTEVAKEWRKTHHFTYTDTVEFADALKNMLGLTEFPAVAVQKKAGDKKKYILRGEITPAGVSKFLRDVNDGAVKAELKSEPVPAKNSDPVKVIVGDTFGEVFDKQKDVMLEVYAPWCGHCKKLEPEYTKLARKILKEELGDLITVAKVDGTANDSPFDSIEWSGFPTIFFVKAGSDKPEVYDGERTGKGLWRHIKKHATKAEEIRERIAKRKNTKTKGEEL